MRRCRSDARDCGRDLEDVCFAAGAAAAAAEVALWLRLFGFGGDGTAIFSSMRRALLLLRKRRDGRGKMGIIRGLVARL